MSSNPIEKARQRIAYHQAEIIRLNAFVETAEAILREPDMPAVAGSSFQPPLVATAIVHAAAGANVVPSSSPTRVILAEAEKILKQEARPMGPGEIYDRIIASGLVVAGQNPKGNLTAKFSTKRDVFHYDKDTGLWSLQRWSQDRPKEAPSSLSEGASKQEDAGAHDLSDLHKP